MAKDRKESAVFVKAASRENLEMLKAMPIGEVFKALPLGVYVTLLWLHGDIEEKYAIPYVVKDAEPGDDIRYMILEPCWRKCKDGVKHILFGDE